MTEYPVLNKLDALMQKIDSMRPISAEVENRVMQKFKIEWNYHSNALEGNTLTFGETAAFLAQGLTASGKPFKDYLDIKGHDKVINVLGDLVRGSEPLTESLIRHLHDILLVEPYEVKSLSPEGLPTSRRVEIGRYKCAPNHVVTSTGTIHYFSSPGETPAHMQELLEWYRKEMAYKTMHPVAFASLFHHRFVNIHPFDDGNGRMARILMNLILMQSKQLVAIIKTESKNDYLFALSNADAGEPDNLINFIGTCVTNSAETFLKAANGEPIDNLGDFDMRLGLLRKTVETQGRDTGGSRTSEQQSYVIERFVVPLFESVLGRFSYVTPLFAQTETSILGTLSGRNVIFNDTNPIALIQSFRAGSFDTTLSKLQLFYNAQGFIKNAQQDFLCSLIVYFHPGHIAITLQLPLTQVVEIYSAQFVSLPGEDAAQEVAKNVLERLLTSLEQVTSRWLP